MSRYPISTFIFNLVGPSSFVRTRDRHYRFPYIYGCFGAKNSKTKRRRSFKVRLPGLFANSISTEVVSVERIFDGYLAKVRDADGTTRLHFLFILIGQITDIKCDIIVNAGGLWSAKLAHVIMRDKCPSNYQLEFCKGHYLQYSGHTMNILRQAKLLYPAPEPGLRGLGIHLTLDIEGLIRFGPDTLYVDDLDYSFVCCRLFVSHFKSDATAEQLKDKFIVAIQRYLPLVQRENLRPAYTGIRPKLAGSKSSFAVIFLEFLDSSIGLHRK